MEIKDTKCLWYHRGALVNILLWFFISLIIDIITIIIIFFLFLVINKDVYYYYFLFCLLSKSFKINEIIINISLFYFKLPR